MVVDGAADDEIGEDSNEVVDDGVKVYVVNVVVLRVKLELEEYGIEVVDSIEL